MSDEPLRDHSLPEHPEATRRRLCEAGLWDDAHKLHSRVRLQIYNHFRRGVKRRLTHNESIEANWASWAAVQKEYPPPPGAAPLESMSQYLDQFNRKKSEDLPALDEQAESRFDSLGDADDHAGDVIWVYNNLENYAVIALECPSRGAWTMLGHGRKDKGWFFEKMYRPVAQQQSKQKAAGEDGEYKPSKAEKLACEDIRRMIEEAVLESSK